MSVQNVSATPHIEWDDSVVFVFSFNAPTGDGGTQQFFCGFVHAQIQVGAAIGSSQQVSQLVLVANQQQIQFASDPQSWIDTVKNAERSAKAISITFDNAISTAYETQTNQELRAPAVVQPRGLTIARSKPRSGQSHPERGPGSSIDARGDTNAGLDHPFASVALVAISGGAATRNRTPNPVPDRPPADFDLRDRMVAVATASRRARLAIAFAGRCTRADPAADAIEASPIHSYARQSSA
jgi:hypothetical protein